MGDAEPTSNLVTRIESTLIAVVEQNRDKLAVVEGLNAYSLDLFPWFGYVYFNVRGQDIPRDSDYYSKPECWDNLILDSQEEELPEFDWLVDYMERTHGRLHDESEEKLRRWDQWLRICAAQAMIGEPFRQALISCKLLDLYPPLDDTNLCQTFYILPGDESALPFTGFNYVAHLCAWKVTLDGPLTNEEIERRFAGCTIGV